MSPTQQPRTQITHTPRVVHALEVARRRWPDETRESALILHLLEEGAHAVESTADYATAERRARVQEVAGKHTDLFDDGYLDDIRTGWPE